MSSKKLSLKTKVSFGIGNIGGLAINQSSILLLFTYYFLHLGVPLTAFGVSLILTVYGIWDALNEPIIGHLSDFTKSRWGRRKPYIIFGSIPLIVFSVLIYTPPINNPVASALYILIMLFFYDLSVTMVVTSWFSLFPEITLDQDERLDLSKFNQIFGIIGLVIGLGVAPIIAGSFSEPLIGYSIMGLVLGLVTVFSMFPTIFFVKEKKEYQRFEKEDDFSFFRAVKISFKNRSFLYFILIQFLLQLSYALVVSSLPLLFEGALGLDTLQWSILLLSTFITVIPGLFIWLKIAGKKGTKYTLFLSMIAFCVVFPFTFIMNSFVISLIILLCGGIGLGGLMLFPTVLLSDVIDEDQIKTNKRREGLFNGVSGVIVKLSSSISWLIIGIVLTIFNIDRNNLSPAMISGFQEIGLRLLVGLIPVIIILIGLLALYFYPLSGKKLEDVKREVEKLNQALIK